MFAIFLGSAIVQYNDSDWIFWSTTYVGAAVFCFGAYVRRLPRWSLLVLSALVLSGAIYWSLGIPSGAPLMSSLVDTEMVQRGSERVREVGGLVLISVWMLILGTQPYEERVEDQ